MSMTAKVLLKEGFRFYRLDNSYQDVRVGDEFNAGDMIPRDLEARLTSKHIEILGKPDSETQAEARAAKLLADRAKQDLVDAKAVQEKADAYSSMTPAEKVAADKVATDKAAADNKAAAAGRTTNAPTGAADKTAADRAAATAAANRATK